MIGRGLFEEGWQTAEGAVAVTYERGLWFRTPEAYDREGNFRASIYLRPLAIWAIEEALRRRRASG
jgi:non-lysosomal glucosylceramidase